MKDILLFHYKPGKTSIHKWDPRLKVLFLISISILIMGLSLLSLGIISLLILFVLKTANIRIKSILGEIKGFLIFILLIIIIKSFSLSNTSQSQTVFNVSFNIADFHNALIFGIKLVSIILLSTAFIQTTSLNSIRSTIIFFLSWIPFIPERIIANICCLSISSLPLITDEYLKVKEANMARCINSYKNPLRNMLIFLKTFTVNIFSKTDHISEAMDARCFNYNRKELDLEFCKSDFYMFLLAIIIFILIFLLDKFIFQI